MPEAQVLDLFTPARHLLAHLDQADGELDRTVPKIPEQRNPGLAPTRIWTIAHETPEAWKGVGGKLDDRDRAERGKIYPGRTAERVARARRTQILMTAAAVVAYFALIVVLGIWIGSNLATWW